MEQEAKLRWIAHCERMAEATYAIADWCEDSEMMEGYMALAGAWLRLRGSDGSALREAAAEPSAVVRPAA